MPLAFYCAPYLVTTPKHYAPEEYYGHLIRVTAAATRAASVVRRVTARNPWPVRLAHLSQSLSYRTQLVEMRAIRRMLRTDRAFRAFHDNERAELPDFYRRRFDQRLGKFAALLSPADRRPVLDASHPGGR